ncbi:FCD domain-containing protein [Kribbella solani]|uniref:FadR/GntR family transcriptional regulator n=1 Tax=Kribbella solani TaxID=236067 RepID=UPI0029BC82A5|nr:FCD domain-containing protein [Kribbella solani]MDX3006559.1 FCD domain-containing protein [Kribbella solani]
MQSDRTAIPGNSGPIERHARLHEQLAADLAAAIVAGRWDAGGLVPTAEGLATHFGVSRTVARETLQALAAAGLVSVRHGKRTIVAPMYEWRFMGDLVRRAVSRGQVSSKVAADLWEARTALEESAITWCIERADSGYARRLRAVALEQVELTRQTPPHLDAITACDLRFHFLIAEGSDNRIVVELINGLRRQLVPTWAMGLVSPEEHREAAAEHLAIADAVTRRDVDGAIAALRGHLRRAAGRDLRPTEPPCPSQGSPR